MPRRLARGNGKLRCESARQRFHVGGVHFHRDGALNQINREDQAELVLLAEQNALAPGQRAATHAHSPPHLQIRVRLRVQMSQAVAQRSDFFFRPTS